VLLQADVNLKFSDTLQSAPDRLDGYKAKPEIKVWLILLPQNRII